MRIKGSSSRTATLGRIFGVWSQSRHGSAESEREFARGCLAEPIGEHERKGMMMNRIDVIRAWKDQAYFDSLTDAQRASLPANPAGLIEITPQQAQKITGGAFGATLSSQGYLDARRSRKYSYLCDSSHKVVAM
jgi:mersacidin/lichenicidin family type 2 lantibiotic